MIFKNALKLLCLLSSSFIFCSCGAINDMSDPTSAGYLGSGSIVISKLVPSSNNLNNILASTESSDDCSSMNQLLGYFPPSEDFTPAFNEMWLEINTKEHTASLMQGSLATEIFQLTRSVVATPGQYYVKAKELNPLWQAPESYFSKRGLSIPEENSRLRSGAFGDKAIFTTSNLVIHNAPFWNQEVGGLRLSNKKLSKVFSSLPLGSPIVVR